MCELTKLGLDKQSSFHRCVCNEFVSILERHCVAQLQCSTEFQESALKIARTLVVRFRALSDQDMVMSRPQRMRKRYTRALSFPLRGNSGFGKSFIKWEKHAYDKDGAIPRLIQYRNGTYTANLAKYIVPLEIKYKTFSPDGNHGFPFVSKGLNARKKAERLRNMFEYFGNPDVWLIDHSKFDSMVNSFHLGLEHWVYQQGCNEYNLKLLLKGQRYNKFVSQNGLKYEFPFRRCSGDANTGCGNCIINYIILRHFFPFAIIIVDGDDSVVFNPKGAQYSLNFKAAGMVTKYDMVTEFHNIEFCQSKPVYTPEGWVMCRNPLRALARMNYKLGIPDPSFYKTVGIGEGLVSSYMPMLSFMAKAYRIAGNRGKFRPHIMEYGTRVLMWTRKFSYPSPAVRASFYETWGITAGQQVAYETQIMNTVLYDESKV